MADTTGITVAERVQLVAAGSADLLCHAPPFALSAAALVELALLGRLGTARNTAFFNGGAPVRLTVLDGTPTGNPVLDAALAPIAARRALRTPDKWIVDLWRVVPEAVVAELTRRGIASAVVSLTVEEAAASPGRTARLRVDDPWATTERRLVSEARAVPEGVTDPRLGAVIDVVDHFGEAFSPEFSARPFVPRQWYPESTRATIEQILRAEMLVTGNQ